MEVMDASHFWQPLGDTDEVCTKCDLLRAEWYYTPTFCDEHLGDYKGTSYFHGLSDATKNLDYRILFTDIAREYDRIRNLLGKASEIKERS